MKHRLPLSILIIPLVLFGCCGSSDHAPQTVVIARKGSGAIRVRLQFRAGSSYDPAGKEGLADFTANALKRGTKQFTRAQIEERLGALSASIDIDVDRDVVSIEARCPTESWPEFSRLFLSVLTGPAFDDSEMARLVNEQLDDIERLRRDDARLAQAALQYYIYWNHPYGHPPEGFDRSVRTFTARDARRFYESHYTSENYILGLAGDVSDSLASSIRSTLEKRLHSGAPPPPELSNPAVVGRNVYLIERENRAQMQLRFGRPIDIGRRDPDFIPLYFANAVLGSHGDPAGRLFKVIRIQRDLAETVGSHIEDFKQNDPSTAMWPGRPRRQQYFSIGVSPKSLNGNFVIHIILKELSDFVADGITREQLNTVRNVAINRLSLESTMPERLLDLRMNEIALGTPAFIDSFAVVARRVTVDDVQRTVARAMDLRNMVMVAVVSNGEDFSHELLDGPMMFEYPSGVDGRSLRKADRYYEAFNPNWDPQRIRIIEADDMFR